MNRHLSLEEIDRLMAEDAPPEDRRHARECQDCAAEVARTLQTLQSFSDAVKQCAERQRGASVPSVPTRTLAHARQRGAGVRRLRWAMGTGLALVVAAIPFFKSAGDRQRELQAQQDALLLDQVNQHISRVVPAPMEPFIELISVDDAMDTGGPQ